MTIKIKLIHVVLVLMLSIGAIIFLGRGIVHRERDRASEAVYEAQQQLKKAAKTYQIYIDGQKKTISEQKRVIMTQEQAIKTHILDKRELKETNMKVVSENVKLRARINILKDSLDMIEPVIIYVPDTSGVEQPYLRLPHKLSYADRWIDLSVSLKRDATWGFDMDKDLSLDITIGSQKTGFLQREPKVLVGYDDPYIGDVHIQSVKIEKEPMFFETLGFRVITHGLSFAAGLYLGGR